MPLQLILEAWRLEGMLLPPPPSPPPNAACWYVWSLLRRTTAAAHLVTSRCWAACIASTVTAASPRKAIISSSAGTEAGSWVYVLSHRESSGTCSCRRRCAVLSPSGPACRLVRAPAQQQVTPGGRSRSLRSSNGLLHGVRARTWHAKQSTSWLPGSGRLIPPATAA
jgi:hypothetical protein